MRPLWVRMAAWNANYAGARSLSGIAQRLPTGLGGGFAARNVPPRSHVVSHHPECTLGSRSRSGSGQRLIADRLHGVGRGSEPISWMDMGFCQAQAGGHHGLGRIVCPGNFTMDLSPLVNISYITATTRRASTRSIYSSGTSARTTSTEIERDAGDRSGPLVQTVRENETGITASATHKSRRSGDSMLLVAYHRPISGSASVLSSPRSAASSCAFNENRIEEG